MEQESKSHVKVEQDISQTVIRNNTGNRMLSIRSYPFLKAIGRSRSAVIGGGELSEGEDVGLGSGSEVLGVPGVNRSMMTTVISIDNRRTRW